MKTELVSSTEALFEIENIVQELLNDGLINDAQFGTILVCLNEAISNSIEHGNEFDDKKKIEFEYFFMDNQIVFTISDKGKGFDFEKYLKQDVDNNKTGILSMSILADGLAYFNNGRQVELRFELSNTVYKLDILRQQSIKNRYSQTKTNSIKVKKDA